MSSYCQVDMYSHTLYYTTVLEGKRPAKARASSWGASSEKKSWEKRRESNSMRRKCVLTSWSEVRTIEAQSGISQESCHPLHQRALPCTVVDKKWLGGTHFLQLQKLILEIGCLDQRSTIWHQPRIVSPPAPVCTTVQSSWKMNDKGTPFLQFQILTT